MAQSIVQPCDQAPFDVDWDAAFAASLEDHSCVRLPTVQGLISQTGEILEFGVVHNDGGAKCVDCGLLALGGALQNTQPEGFEKNLFNGPPRKIRREIWTMFNEMDEGVQLAMVSAYLGEDVSMPLSNKTYSDMKVALMTSMLFWDTLVQYVQWKFPNQVNMILWRQQHGESRLVCQPTGDFDPARPMIHIMYYTCEHFEELRPADAKAAANAIVEAAADAIAEARAMEEERSRFFELLPHLFR